MFLDALVSEFLMAIQNGTNRYKKIPYYASVKVLVAFTFSCLLHKQREDALARGRRNLFNLTLIKVADFVVVRDNIMVEKFIYGAMIPGK